MTPPIYNSLKNKKLKKLSGEEISYNEFIKLVKEMKNLGLNLYIGTDSQEFPNSTVMVTCIVFHKTGLNRSAIIYFKDKVKNNFFHSLRDRMFAEAMISLQAAMEISEFYSDDIEIHLDVGSNEKLSKTFKFKNELERLVLAQGYRCEVKPNSWASSFVADRFTKSE